MIRVLLTSVLVFFLSGCVSAISIDQQTPKANYVVTEKVLISIIDQRKKVKEGKDKTFIGVAHSTFGIPVDWHVKHLLATEKEDKNRNLGQWLTHRIVAGLNNKGWQAEAVELEPSATEAEIKNALNAAGATTLIQLTLDEWYFSINLNWVSAFNFDTDTVVDIYHLTDGNVLSKRFKERDVIEESASESPQNNVLKAYREQLQQIFNDVEVKRALTKS